MNSEKSAKSEVELEAMREALRASEERYRLAFESTGTAMMVLDEDTTISMWNHRLEEISGYTSEEALRGRKWTEFVFEADLPRMHEYHVKRRIDPSSVPTEYEFRLKHKNGGLRDVFMNAALIPDTTRTLISLIDITDRKRMDRALRESEQRFRDLFENANDIIYVHDFQGNFLSANTAALRTYGYTARELLATNIKSLVDPQWLPIAMEKIQEKLSVKESTAPYELLTYTKNHEPVWVEVSTRIIVENGSAVGVQGIARDITDRRRAQEQLHQSERRFKEMAELLPCAVCETDGESAFTYVNQLGLRTFGFSQADVDRGFPLLSVIHPSYHAQTKSNIKQIMSGKIVGPQEYKMVWRDGTVRDYILNSSPIEKGNRITGLRTCLFDITDMKSAEKQIRESEERFRGIYAHSPIGIALFSPEGRPLDMNNAFRTMFGLGDGPSGPGLFELLSLNNQQKHQLESGKGLEHEAARGSGERERWLSWNCTPLGNSNGVPTSILIQVQDVTERRRAQNALLHEARSEAEHANRMVESLKKEMAANFTFRNMVSRSPQMMAIFDILPEMAQTPTTVLITGESGTGKELIAHAIHDQSPRQDEPFVAINCSALPDNLLESELFGYKAGAFTDAKKDKPGKFALAEGGTIFLDEIGDISPAMQVKLLRVLQERVYEPLGGTQPMKADVRVITATNKDLPAMVKEGRFREDLFYRIKVLQVKLPPLRERRVDIPLLCEHFVTLFNQRFHKRISAVSQEALDTLLAHDFPGNIRELENVIEHAFVFCKGTAIETSHLPAELVSGRVEVSAPTLTKVENFDELEKMFIEKILAETGGNKLKAAAKLGIHKATLFRKLHKLGIQ